MADSEVVLIDTLQRLRTVARLASSWVRYRPAFDAIRNLALAAGCEVRGGWIFERPAGRYAPLAHGWEDFVEQAAAGNLPPRLREAMIAGGGSVTLDDDLVARLRAAREQHDAVTAPNAGGEA